MDLKLEIDDKRISAALDGNFTFEDNREFKQLLDKVNTKEITDVFLDFSGLEHIDSAALGMMIMLKKCAEKEAVSVTIKNPTGQVKKVLDLSGFYELFKIVS